MRENHALLHKLALYKQRLANSSSNWIDQVPEPGFASGWTAGGFGHAASVQRHHFLEPEHVHVILLADDAEAEALGDPARNQELISTVAIFTAEMPKNMLWSSWNLTSIGDRAHLT
jgi:hypothetical protein